MTKQEILAATVDILTPADIAEVLQSDPQDIRNTARNAPDDLRFNFSFVGNRMKIPREAFIKYMGWEGLTT